MEPEIKQYNVYCDESSIENKENQYMIIGAIFLKRQKRDELKGKIKALLDQYNYRGEIKWTKLTKRLLPLYQDLIDLFFDYSDEDFKYHCIRINRNDVRYDLYHNNDQEEGFYKFYYQLLKNKFLNDCEYYVFLDYKPTKRKNRIKILEHYLKYRILSNYSNSKIRHIQAYQSKENYFIQLADLFSGAVGHSNNQKNGSAIKREFINYLSSRLDRRDLSYCTPPFEKKFNIFCIDLKGERNGF